MNNSLLFLSFVEPVPILKNRNQDQTHLNLISEELNGIRHPVWWQNALHDVREAKENDYIFVTLIKIGLEWKMKRIESHHS
ncbi:hypothetical protein [Marinobacter sp. 2_MG-2023]|uniref:hypothetical protein n=1 Tax=Marinobacter sp. 2_MG-2023 TaxID=3062679 RepID=UPI0026E16B8F|nr:hypothetical protein [Marinobacter sp. 2_MG-2023]MDO6442696.1 hypothetical protein [Marinobacter sp. 2_MG-2023]